MNTKKAKIISRPDGSADAGLCASCQKILSLMARSVLIALGLMMPSVQAQTNMTMKPTPQRVEVPTGNTSTYYVTNCALRIPTNGATGVDGTGTNWLIAPVNVSVSGAPVGCTASLVASDLITPIGPIPINMNINNASTTTNLVLKLVFDGSEVGGTTNLVITATGGGLPDDDLFLPLDIAKIWNGSGNAALNGYGSWSDGAQWLGGALQPNDTVVFTDLGAQTNGLATVSGVFTNSFLTNSLISSSVTLSSLRFAITQGGTNYHNLYINPGVSLAIAGDGGFKLLRDYSYWNQKMFVNIWGTNGTFIQTNENSTFTLLGGDDQQQSVLDMSGLGNLHLDVASLNLDSYQGYPNYANLVVTNSMNGTTVGTGKPQKIYGTWKMAMTNYVKATYVDPYNYTNALSRSYALTLGRNDGSGGGSGKDCELYLGFSNVFNLDSICISGPSSYGADFHFQNANSYAKFRNADGVSRMSVFATADLGGQSSGAGDKSKCGGNGSGVDFTLGTVDMLVDRLYLSMDGTNASGSASGGFSQTSGFYVSAGVIDANTAILGYQSQGNSTNTSTCYANVYVTNTAVLKVNNTLELGHTTAATMVSGQPCYGKLNIGPGGTVMANNIAVGGLAKTSVNNNIALLGNATLIVSNRIADATANGALGTLSFAGGNNTIKLFLDGSNPAAMIYATNFTAAGTGNKLVIGSINNLTYPADVIIVQGAGAAAVNSAAFDAGVVMPSGSGLSGTLSTDTGNNRIMLHIINRTPNHLVWRGPAGGTGTADWDYVTQNWQDQVTLMMTNYDNPDIVAFDDAAGYATNINITGATVLTPAVINVTNSTLYYTFVDGGNQIVGGPALNKYGTGTVEVDGNTTFSVQLYQGTLTGFSPGTIGNAVISSGAVMNYFGNLGGSLTCSGTASSAGTIAGSVSVLSGGIVTNASSGTIQNPISVLSGGFFYNAGTLKDIGVGSSGSPQVASGGTLVNDGTIGQNLLGNILFVSGTFEDLGDVSDNITVHSVTVGAGGVFIPGGPGLGTSAINSDGTSTPDSFPGTALLQLGSTNVFKINVAAATNTLLLVNNLSFGASSGQRSQNGCTLLITNTTPGTPFSAGQSYHLFGYVGNPGQVPYNTGSSTNTYPAITPATPGTGLVWDLSQLWVSGNLGIVAAGTGPVFTNSFTLVGGTNIVGQFNWDSSYLGYRLQNLVTTLNLGLADTNWTSVAGSWTNSSVTLTNVIGTNCVFYRLVFP